MILMNVYWRGWWGWLHHKIFTKTWTTALLRKAYARDLYHGERHYWLLWHLEPLALPTLLHEHKNPHANHKILMVTCKPRDCWSCRYWLGAAGPSFLPTSSTGTMVFKNCFPSTGSKLALSATSLATFGSPWFIGHIALGWYSGVQATILYGQNLLEHDADHRVRAGTWDDDITNNIVINAVIFETWSNTTNNANDSHRKIAVFFLQADWEECQNLSTGII